MTISLPAAGATLPSPEHLVQFYETDEFLADAVARFVRVGLERGDPVLVVATSAHRAAVLEVLRRMDVDVDAAARDGMLVLLDATTAAETIVVDGRPDPARFEAFVAQPLRALAGRSGRPVRVYGEIVDVLWRDGRRAAALALEEMWNALQTRERFSLLCAYLMNSFLRHSGIPEVCAVHGHVHAPEGSSPTISIAEPTADVRALIQEVAFRRELEGALRDTVSQLEAVTAQLRTATSELQDFLDAAPVPIHRVAGSGTILWANAAELELLGYHYDEYVGHPIAKFHADKALIETILERLSRGETLRDVEATVIAKDGSLRHVQISTNARVHDGQLIATRCFTRDRTALRHAERRAAILHRLSLALSPTLGADEAARIVLDELTAIIPDARCSLTLVDAERGAPVAAGTTVFPIAFDDHPLAVITITPPQDRPLSPAERDLLDGIRRECAQALERARLHDGMVAARADAVAANRAKDEFLAMLGHELRNPLSPIATAVQLLRDRGDGGDRELGIIDRQVIHLTRLVDDLLDVSRITRRIVQVEKRVVALAPILRRAIEIVSPFCASKEQELVVSIPDAAVWVDADETRMCQVFSNLLINAAKYTPPRGRIETAVELGETTVTVRIRDNGEGIAPELLPRVFDLFVQGEGTPARPRSGLGVGLALVRELVTMHDGAVTATSAGAGHGTELRVVLPVSSTAKTPTPPHGIDNAERAEVRRRTILVVDDNHDGGELLGELLAARGHRVAVAFDGAEALAAVVELRPDVAILDIGLPDMDGYALARALRERLGPELHLVAVSGYGQPEDRARAIEAGFYAHFVKPVAVAKLLAAIEPA